MTNTGPTCHACDRASHNDNVIPIPGGVWVCRDCDEQDQQTHDGDYEDALRLLHEIQTSGQLGLIAMDRIITGATTIAADIDPAIVDHQNTIDIITEALDVQRRIRAIIRFARLQAVDVTADDPDRPGANS